MPEIQGTNILFRRWDAAPSPASPKAVFLLVHGLGAHSARWDFLAGYLAEVVIRNKKVQEEVRKLRRNYLEMKFCLSLEEALPLAAGILKSIFPRPGVVERLVEELRQKSERK
jgi:hypothetical protein